MTSCLVDMSEWSCILNNQNSEMILNLLVLLCLHVIVQHLMENINILAFKQKKNKTRTDFGAVLL